MTIFMSGFFFFSYFCQFIADNILFLAHFFLFFEFQLYFFKHFAGG